MGLTNYFKIHYWPVITCAWFVTTFIISYLVSVLGGNVYAFFPYISDTGALPPESCIFGQMLNIGAVLSALPPESCIFGQMLNIGAVLMAVSMYIRYRQIEISIDTDLITLKKWWNTVSITIGALACFGVSLVGNFQETTVESIHFIGALFAFIIGSFYFIMQTRISYEYTKIFQKLPSHGISINLFYLRVFLSIWLLPLITANLACAFESLKYFTGKSMVYWREEDGGFQLRLAGTFTEWILALFMFVYIATFTKEFQSIQFKEINMKLLPTERQLKSSENV